MNKTLIFIISVILISVLVIWMNKSSIFKVEEEYIPNEYEINVIEYFKEIALNTEYDDSPERVIKWKKPMSLFIYAEKNAEEQTEVIKNTITKINELATDGFMINMTRDIRESNAVLYLCKKDRVRELNPKLYQLLEDEILGSFTGMTYVEFKLSNFVITNALIFIDEDVSVSEQNTAIIEELTQSIGLLNDSEKYSNSVFYESADGIENTDYSDMDRELISLLYSKKMTPGFRETSVETVIKKVFRDKQNSSDWNSDHQR